MARKISEKGQALILVVFGIVVLIGLTGLAIDGGNAYSDRRNAQNAADTAALAGALSATQSGADPHQAAVDRASSNGYSSANSAVTVTVQPTTGTECPLNADGQDVTVQIVSSVPTYFARVLGIAQMTNTVSAQARGCGTTTAPLFNGNAIVGLAPSGTDFSAFGTPAFDITGGGVFSNSSSSDAAGCGGAASITAPSVTVVGGTSFGCHGNNIDGITTGAGQYTWAEYKNLLPPTPACDGSAYQAGGQWYPQAGANGSQVSFSGSDMNFTAGLYCVTNSPGPYHGQITGAQDVTFYMMDPNFSMKFNGHGIMTASAPTTGPYAGVLMYIAPQTDSNGNLVHSQSLDMRGNGTADVTGSVIAPSADVTMYGNSGTGAYDSQVVGYTVTSGGNADINVTYNQNDNYQANVQASVTLLK